MSGNKEIFARNLVYYMEKKGVDRNQLCADLDLKYTTVRDWTKGITYPRIGKVELLANYFGIQKSDLIEDKEPSIEKHQTNEIESSTLQQITDTSSKLVPERQLVVLDIAEKQLEEQNTVQEQPVQYDSNKVIPLYKQYEEDEYEEVLIYGEPSAGRGTWLSDESIESIMYPKPVPDHDIALRVRGNSMEPLFQDGEIVFVRKTKNVNHGQIIIIIVNNEAYIKKLYKHNQEVRLISLNSEYDDIILTEYDDVDVVGTVIL
ncbi:LexA family transcriptional regulator [Streptococcus sp. 121]|uniref:S24 family peptidase n=1 Tax=Streptococcus sp. 121 TaxID=2797637 RepID=UPI0018F0B692|nr:S24 family peptidase [Streptococcus sp. 121]MBJ6745542.1 LexA family transcriptional regulator [Streptococcus sp. 121]